MIRIFCLLTLHVAEASQEKSRNQTTVENPDQITAEISSTAFFLQNSENKAWLLANKAWLLTAMIIAAQSQRQKAIFQTKFNSKSSHFRVARTANQLPFNQNSLKVHF